MGHFCAVPVGKLMSYFTDNEILRFEETALYCLQGILYFIIEFQLLTGFYIYFTVNN